MKNLLTILICFVSLNLSANPEEDEIRSIMAAQEKAWNQGDLEGFMAGYWRSKDLTFVGQSGLKHGWKVTLDNYKKNYPDKETMGKLKFTILEVEQEGDSAFVLGKWHLTREKDSPNGHFTLFWRKVEGAWKIVIDHSS